MPHPRLSGPDVAILQRARAPVWRPAAHLKRHKAPERASRRAEPERAEPRAGLREEGEGLPNMGPLPSPSSTRRASNMYLVPKLGFKGTRAQKSLQRSLHDCGSRGKTPRYKAMDMQHDWGGKLEEKI